MDKGYQAADNCIKQPIKGSRRSKVAVFGKVYNHLLSTLRIYVGHHSARLQQSGVLRDLYRGASEAHEDIFTYVQDNFS